LKNYSKEFLKDLYSTMYKTRRFEEEVFEFYKKGEMPGLAHLYLGEESIATGVCAGLEENDYIGSTHRGHGHLVARGADTKKMMAEILGKADGYSKGKGGSMHIMALDKGILGANGIVGAEIPIATGAAYKSKVKNSKQVTISFFGDAASNQGIFHESINMAAAWDLPIVYIVENNLYGISVDIRKVTKEVKLSERARAYGIEGVTIDGNDVLKVYETAKKAIDKARNGGGPTIIECLTYRHQGHHVGDPGIYKDEEEQNEWKNKKDPLKRFKEYLLSEKIFTEKEIEKINEEADKEISEAAKFAHESPYPDSKEAFTDVYA
jgi:pyruvate dehydrogenase E1 component alpha subunit